MHATSRRQACQGEAKQQARGGAYTVRQAAAEHGRLHQTLPTPAGRHAWGTGGDAGGGVGVGGDQVGGLGLGFPAKHSNHSEFVSSTHPSKQAPGILPAAVAGPPMSVLDATWGWQTSGDDNAAWFNGACHGKRQEQTACRVRGS